VQLQVAPPVADTSRGVIAAQLLFIEFIHAALAALLGDPGVSFPATGLRTQFVCSAGLLFVALFMKQTIPPDAPGK
jgi:hypothetical protein